MKWEVDSDHGCMLSVVLCQRQKTREDDGWLAGRYTSTTWLVDSVASALFTLHRLPSRHTHTQTGGFALLSESPDRDSPTHMLLRYQHLTLLYGLTVIYGFVYVSNCIKLPVICISGKLCIHLFVDSMVLGGAEAASPWRTLGIRSCRTFCSDLANALTQCSS